MNTQPVNPISAANPIVAVNPIAVEVTRGDTVESRHRACAVVPDASGTIVARWGDVEAPVFPRSAIKPIQALPLVETGAAERFGLSDAELALACASHAAEPMHIAVVGPWLARIGLGEADLECGVHLPSSEAAAIALLQGGGAQSQLHNNCSGKHTGFLTTAVHKGERPVGYIHLDHPVQQRVTRAIGEMAGVDMARAPVGIDGCSIPTLAIPLAALATAFARFADPSGLAPERAAAIQRIRAAMVARPEMISGTGRLCTRLVAASGGRIIAKTGAEGVYAAALPEAGLGVAVKADDGAHRAAEVTLIAVLRHLGALDDDLAAELAGFAEAPLVNRAGRHIGVVRTVPGWPA